MEVNQFCKSNWLVILLKNEGCNRNWQINTTISDKFQEKIAKPKQRKIFLKSSPTNLTQAPLPQDSSTLCHFLVFFIKSLTTGFSIVHW